MLYIEGLSIRPSMTSQILLLISGLLRETASDFTLSEPQPSLMNEKHRASPRVRLSPQIQILIRNKELGRRNVLTHDSYRGTLGVSWCGTTASTSSTTGTGTPDQYRAATLATIRQSQAGDQPHHTLARPCDCMESSGTSV